MKKSITTRYLLMSIGFGIAMGVIFPIFSSLFIKDFKSIQHFVIYAGSCVAAGILVGLFAYWIGQEMMIKYIRKIKDFMQNLSEGDGNLNARIDIISDNEIGELCGYFNSFMEKMKVFVSRLQAMLHKIRGLGNTLTSSSEETFSTIEGLWATLTSMDNRMNTLEAQTRQTRTVISDIAAFVRKVGSLIQRQHSALTSSMAIFEQMMALLYSAIYTAENKRVSGDILASLALQGKDGMDKTVYGIGEIAKSTELILSLIAVINDVAEQTNMLAMNAAIEAAHAGEYGMGFGVVADEIRFLAEETRNNAKNISVSLNSVTEKIKLTEETTRIAGENNAKIVAGITEIAKSIEEIRQGMQELNQSSEKITGSLQPLLEVSEEVRVASNVMVTDIEEMNHSMDNLANLSHENRSGMKYIVDGMQAIVKSVQMLSTMSENNSENITVLEEVIAKFRTS